MFILLPLQLLITTTVWEDVPQNQTPKAETPRPNAYDPKPHQHDIYMFNLTDSTCDTWC